MPYPRTERLMDAIGEGMRQGALRALHGARDKLLKRLPTDPKTPINASMELAARNLRMIDEAIEDVEQMRLDDDQGVVQCGPSSSTAS